MRRGGSAAGHASRHRVGPAESVRPIVDPLPPNGSSLDPEIDPPFNIRRLTATGERAAWSPDGKKIAYVNQSFGDAYEIDVATGVSRSLTTFYTHPGYLRVDYLADGDFLFSQSDRGLSDAQQGRLVALLESVFYPPSIRLCDPDDHSNGGRLAGAVRPQEAKHTPGPHLKAQLIDGRKIAKLFSDALDPQCRRTLAHRSKSD